jgi:excisionase family DNA binding protein
MQLTEHELITRADAASKLGLSVATVDRMVKSGELRAYRTGKRRIGFCPEDIMKASLPVPVMVSSGRSYGRIAADGEGGAGRTPPGSNERQQINVISPKD